ncbi:hypothetical protein C4D60_Mb08t24850 [Musa balbisiana]|uniref:Uncharacterized protein n=1 Tax=Musa balbisiana TaxID=52838 RepID=A0A4V4H971_MUSBA|nr:hypothetical protein C4D60_Mb08t24850 [Musa balbisiana]
MPPVVILLESQPQSRGIVTGGGDPLRGLLEKPKAGEIEGVWEGVRDYGGCGGAGDRRRGGAMGYAVDEEEVGDVRHGWPVVQISRGTQSIYFEVKRKVRTREAHCRVGERVQKLFGRDQPILA